MAFGVGVGLLMIPFWFRVASMDMERRPRSGRASTRLGRRRDSSADGLSKYRWAAMQNDLSGRRERWCAAKKLSVKRSPRRILL